jgi:enoyl-[acyl-carrier protein] reductase I
MTGTMLPTTKKISLIMGVANQRSIAWSCMERFLQKDWYVIYTVQSDKSKERVEKMLDKAKFRNGDNILGGFACDVTDAASMETFFQEKLPETLHHSALLQTELQSLAHPPLHAVIHSLAFAPNLKTPLLETTKDSFLEAHDVSAYSLIQVARESLPYLQASYKAQQCSIGETDEVVPPAASPSLTTLSYLGSARAIPGYNVMGPAKASLESVVRGLALELGSINHAHNETEENNSNPCGPIRVNAVRAGPLPTVSSKGGIAGFERMRQDVETKAPLGNVTASQVASSVYHLAAEAYGVTGQTIDVDGGYSIVAGPDAAS